jgi:hypothetical protein
MQRLLVTIVLSGFGVLNLASATGAQSNVVPLSSALRTLSAHVFDGFVYDRGNRLGQEGRTVTYKMTLAIDGFSQCQIRVDGSQRSSPDDVASCKGYSGTDPSLAAAAFTASLKQLRAFASKTAYINVAETTEGSSKLKRATYATPNSALITIDMSERGGVFAVTVSVSPIFAL